MSAQDRYTKVIESLVNGDEASASDLLHEAFVEKAREIWADLVEADEIVEDDVETELDEEIGDEEAGDFLDDLETNEDEIDSEETYEADDEPEMDMDMDAEMELAGDDEPEMDMDDGEEAEVDAEEADEVEAEFASVQDALDDLKATFAEIMGDAEPADEPADEAMAFEADEAEELEEAKDDDEDEADEKIDEAAELTKIGKDKAVHPVDMPAGDDGKASPVGPGTDEVTKDGGPVSTDTKEPAPVKVATAKDMGVTHPGDGASLKPETRGHGAEKKGKAE